MSAKSKTMPLTTSSFLMEGVCSPTFGPFLSPVGVAFGGRSVAVFVVVLVPYGPVTTRVSFP